MKYTREQYQARIDEFQNYLKQYLQNLQSYEKLDNENITNIIECSSHSIYAINHIVRTALMILKNTPHLKHSAKKYQDLKQNINVYVISTMYPYPMPNNKIKITKSLNPDVMQLMSEFDTKPLVLASLNDNQEEIHAAGKSFKAITILTNPMIQDVARQILKVMSTCTVKGLEKTTIYYPNGDAKRL